MAGSFGVLLLIEREAVSLMVELASSSMELTTIDTSKQKRWSVSRANSGCPKCLNLGARFLERFRVFLKRC
jgi:hypothetical protein